MIPRRTARTMCAEVDASVMPANCARALLFQKGAPRPESAGMKNTPPVSGTLPAKVSLSPGESMSLNWSWSQLMHEPAEYILPSSAYATPSFVLQATVVINWSCRIGVFPMFANIKAPVPKVVLKSPLFMQFCPNREACWSPISPPIDNFLPAITQSPIYSSQFTIWGSAFIGTPKNSHSSGSQFCVLRLYSKVLLAFEWSVANFAPFVRQNIR